MDIELNLTTEGATAVGGYLALAAKKTVNNPPKNWLISLKFDEKKAQPEVKVSPMGQ